MKICQNKNCKKVILDEKWKKTNFCSLKCWDESYLESLKQPEIKKIFKKMRKNNNKIEKEKTEEDKMNWKRFEI